MRKVMGNKTKEFFDIPDLMNYVIYSKNETLFMFGSIEKETKEKKFCMGVGRVTHIEKGNEMDLVWINFGRKYSRKIIVISNQARRQIFTLKHGQLTWFYGYMKTWGDGVGKTKMQLFAKGFQGWYVPKNLDIKNYDLGCVEPMSDKDEQETKDFIENILNGED